MQNFIIETDSQTLVKALRSEELDRAKGGVLFREAKFVMATAFNKQTLVKALHSEELVRAKGGVLFREVKFVMATTFNSVMVKHVSRVCNIVAHGLAHVGCNADLDHPSV